MRSKRIMAWVLAWGAILCVGCISAESKGAVPMYPVAAVEPLWIRDGEPVIYDSQKWYPQDDVETLQDSEVFLLGEYRGVQIFIDKTDVKPYERLYTKFGPNKFRYYILKAHD